MSILVIGSGPWGRTHARTLMEMGELYGVEDISDVPLTDLLNQYGGWVEKTIEGRYRWNPGVSATAMEGVVIATPFSHHIWGIREWLGLGMPVLVEKPVVSFFGELGELDRIVNSRKPTAPLMAGHLLIFSNQYRTLKTLLDERKENILAINFVRRKNSRNREEGVFLSLAPHDIALVDYLLSGIEYENGSVICNSQGTTAMASIRCRAMNRIVTLDGLWSFDIGIPKREVVVVTNQTTYVVSEGEYLRSFIRGDDGMVVMVTHSTIDIPPLTLELEHFIDCIRHDREPLTGWPHIERVYDTVLECIVD